MRHPFMTLDDGEEDCFIVDFIWEEKYGDYSGIK